jgi:hypothetical protein
MSGDDWRAVVRVIGDRGNVPVHAEILAENGVVWLARFTALRAKGQRMKIVGRRAKEGDERCV